LSKKGKYQIPQPGNPATPPAAPAQPSTPPDDKAALDAILQKIEKERERPCIVYWTTPLAKIALGVEIPLFDQLSKLGKQKAIDLILFTNGGDAEAPLRIVSLLREYCEFLSVLIPHRAYSAGTLIALGANEIVMTPLSILGPIDPSRTHPLLPKREGTEGPEPISVQDLRHAMQFIREAASTKESGVVYTPEAMAQIFSALFDKIHPLAIGAIEQTYALAKLIGTRCLETHMGTEAAAVEKITNLVDKLCDQYKSHSYPISRVEAKAIGLNVEFASETLQELLTELLVFYTQRKVGPFGQVSLGKTVKAHIAWLDSPRLKFRVEQELLVAQNNEMKSKSDQWLLY
jgi:hypothetical protein